LDFALGGQVGGIGPGRYGNQGGLIGAVGDPVTRYLPELKGSAWEK